MSINKESGSNQYTIFCSKCKSIEDTFEQNEKPEEYGWIFYRKKWYCPICKRSMQNNQANIKVNF